MEDCACPKSKMAYQKVLSEEKSNALVGKSIGEEIDGIFLDLPGYRLKITGVCGHSFSNFHHTHLETIHRFTEDPGRGRTWNCFQSSLCNNV